MLAGRRSRRPAQAQDDITCRLTAHLLGIRLVLVDGGVFVGAGSAEAADARGAEPLAVVRMLKRLNAGRDLGGSHLDEPTAFAVGVRLRERGAGIAAEAVAAGAVFIALPPIYEPKRFRAATAAVANVAVPIFAETRLLPDAATAEELDNELPQLSVPPRLHERLRADTQEDGRGVLRFCAAWRNQLEA